MIQPEVLFLAVLVLSAIIIPCIWHFRLLSIPEHGVDGALALMTPLIGFLIFLSTCAYVPSMVEKLLNYTATHGLSAFSHLEMQSLPQLAALIVSAILLVGFTKIHAESAKISIWGHPGGIKAGLLFFGKGILYCLLTYPIVMTVVQAIHSTLEAMGYVVTQEQLSLVQLKRLYTVPWLFWTMTAAIVTVVPLVEELLFRGLLQNFFQNLVGARVAIYGASILFAIFHYAPEQSITNIELMVGLCLYAYFMGTFYCRTRSLWVPIGMHATFNSLSIALLLYT